MGLDNFEVSLASRKAKKHSQLNSQPAEVAQTIVETQAAMVTPTIKELRNDIQTKNSSALVTEISDEELSRLASLRGLKLAPARPQYVKHTYSVQPNTKSLFKSYNDVLGTNLQDTFEEALQLFFAKHKESYDRVTKAKSDL